jgi:hemolysin III
MVLDRVHREELANALSHGLGLALSLSAGAVMITLAAVWGDVWQIVSAAVYSTTLVLLYVASTVYHAVPDPHTKARLRILDHCAIFLLIAGTYTPFTLVNLRDGIGFWLFALIWSLAAAGIVFKLFFTGRFPRVSTALFVAMGWIALIAIVPLVRALPVASLVALFIGGVFYTGGTWFYHHKTLPYAHAVWHFFVLAGSVSHFVAVFIALL